MEGVGLNAVNALKLTDAQMSCIMDAAAQYGPLARSRFLVVVAARLPTTPTDGELQAAVQAALSAFMHEAQAS